MSKFKKARHRYKPKGRMLVFIQAVLSILLIRTIFVLGMLPAKMIIYITLFLCLLLAFTIFINRNRKERTVGRKLVSLLIIVLLLTSTFYMSKINSAMKRMTNGDDNNDMSTIDETMKQPFNVYISGIDVYGDIETNSRSDVNIIATVNPITHHILLTTTPRDYYVPISGISSGQNDKLTHAGIYGVSASMRTLEDLYNTDIDFYVRVNFTSLIEIVDQLDGLDVNSEYEFTTSKNSGLVIDVQEGVNHFDGEQALAFSRERKNLAGGDNQRGKNQEAVITAIIDKLSSPTMIVKASGIIDSISKNVDTNLSMRQIQSFTKLQLKESEGWEVTSVAAEGTGGNDYCYSGGGNALYVTYPDGNSVTEISKQINNLLHEQQ